MVFFPSLLDGLARTLSMKKGETIARMDSGREAAETMAKDAKNNALMLSSSGTAGSTKLGKFASVCSKRGEKGINQDSAVVWQEFGSQEDMIFCGIYDGHGPWGHVIAKRVRKSVPSSLLCSWQEKLSLTSDCSSFPFDAWKQSFLKTYAEIDQELKLDPTIDSFRSGSTALSIVIQDEHIVIANAGDSRAVLATSSESDKGLIPIQLTVDFKPNLPQEAERIMRCRGQVVCIEDEPGVYRVWRPGGCDSPGLAVSRAFGDYCLKEFGLISVPDVTHRRITHKDQFVILATDGVWDVISNQEAVKIVESALDRGKSSKRLVERAVQAWKRKRRSFAMDDISAVCLFFSLSPSQHEMIDPFVVSKGVANKKAC